MFTIAHKIEAKASNINKVVFYLTFSDVCTWGPYTILTTMGGIYLEDKLGKNALEIIGIGVFVYFITRAALQIPIGMITDKIKRDRDEIISLTVGNVLMGLPFVLYPEISSAFFYFVLQFIFGVGTAMNLVNWRKLFAKNLDKGKEGFEYGFYEMILSFATAIFTAIAGIIADSGSNYFDWVMRFSGMLMMSASLWAGMIYFVHRRKSARLNV